MKKICEAKHVKYEPGKDEWACPKCGEVELFYVDVNVEDETDEECELLHEADLIVCDKCTKTITGKAFSALLVKKNNMVVCPCCKGKGYVVDDRKSKVEGRHRRGAAQ
jgi:uncharacterized protein YbaR (Trm112 family)